MPLSPNSRGALYMVVAMAVFTMGDAITKYSSESMNMAQVMLVRGVFATALVALLAWFKGALAAPRLMWHPVVMLRVFGEAGGTVSFLVALAHLPLANVSAVLQALPLAVTMGAALFFGEGVGWRRWLAITAGFAGVLVIVRPGLAGFSTYSLLVLACVIFCAVRDLATKRLPDDIPTLLVSTVTAFSITVIGALLLSPMGGWSPMSTGLTALLGLAAVLVVIGYQTIILAMRIGDISFIAPFRYTALLWAIMLGFIVFSDIPNLPMVAGAAIIIVSGLYTLYRERVTGRGRAATESAGPNLAPDGI